MYLQLQVAMRQFALLQLTKILLLPPPPTPPPLIDSTCYAVKLAKVLEYSALHPCRRPRHSRQCLSCL